MKPICMIAVLALVASGVSGQDQLSAVATQNPLPINTVGQIAIECTGTATLSSGCGIIEVRQDSPTGPVVYQPFICPLLLIIVGPGAPYTAQWPGTATPGMYYIRIDYTDMATSTFQTAWFPVRVDDPAGTNGPVLTSSGSITGGMTTAFDLSSPADAGSIYIFGASMTTNQGFFANPTTHVALDMDGIFNLSYPAAWPNIFNNFVGTLDANGNSNGVSINVPLGVLTPGGPAAVQSVVLTAGGGLSLSNPLTFSTN